MKVIRWCPPILRYLALLLVVLALPDFLQAQDKPNFAKWEKEIAAFEKQDQEKAPPPGGVVFVGSSTIRLWKLDKSFPELHALNRGFGGSQLADSVHFAPRIVLKYQPRVVVLYAGDNDLAARKTPEQVFADFQTFATLIHQELPKTKLIYLSIKPSVKRWSIWDKDQKANALIEAYCKHDPRRVFLDIAPALLGDDHKPRPELFIADGLHLNEKGYAQVANLLKPLLN
jgi:lysophospholipase L1-like esterase